MQINLKNQVALVTGATGQLGRVMAKTLAQCGADIIVHYHKNEEKANALVNEIQAMGQRAVAIQADITDFESIKQMKEACIAQLGQPDIVINNAVSQYQWTTILEQAPEDYIDQFQTCVMQSVLMAKAFIPAMIEKKGGRFIGINTECSMQNFPGQSAYVAGKRGMDGVYRILAKEVGEHQITVNQIAPGWTISDREREQGIAASEAYIKNVPLNRRGTDQEIANVVAFIASDLASFITGAYIPVCGGYVMPTI